jgi:hypothetical protein
MRDQDSERQLDYWPVVIFYSNDEISANRIFRDRQKAESWAKRQKKSSVVKKIVVEQFTRDLDAWRKHS